MSTTSRHVPHSLNNYPPHGVIWPQMLILQLLLLILKYIHFQLLPQLLGLNSKHCFSSLDFPLSCPPIISPYDVPLSCPLSCHPMASP